MNQSKETLVPEAVPGGSENVIRIQVAPVDPSPKRWLWIVPAVAVGILAATHQVFECLRDFGLIR